MPVSPNQARKIAESLNSLVTRIDQKIIADFIKQPATTTVQVNISEEQYKDNTVQEYIRDQYRGDWDVNFSCSDVCSPAEWARGEGYYLYYCNLTARPGRYSLDIF